MDGQYISKRKFTKLLKYITHKKYKVYITDEHNCSYEGCSYCNKYTGVIQNFTISTYENAEIKLIIDFTDNTSAEIWLSKEYYLYKFDLHDQIIYEVENGDGTYSHFTIEIL